MPNFINLPPFAEDGDVHVVVETPRGSRAKFAYDPKLETFILSKSLLTGLTYPHDWGFVPSTKADDGDPLDILVLMEASVIPGCVVRARLVGAIEAEQKGKSESWIRNDRLIAIAAYLSSSSAGSCANQPTTRGLEIRGSTNASCRVRRERLWTLSQGPSDLELA